MSTRVSPLERIRADIDDLFASDRDRPETAAPYRRPCVTIQIAPVMVCPPSSVSTGRP